MAEDKTPKQSEDVDPSDAAGSSVELVDAEQAVDDTSAGSDSEGIAKGNGGKDESAEVRPAKRRLTQAPVKKAQPTPKQKTTKARKRTTPARFVTQSVGELRKVVWPTGGQTRNYFVAVLVFVIFIMAFVGVFDFAFTWAFLKWLG